MKQILLSLTILLLSKPFLYSLFLHSLRKAFSPIRILIIPLFLLAATLTGYSQPANPYQPFARRIVAIHDYGCGGVLEYKLRGGSYDYSFRWLYNGAPYPATTLRITGLLPGNYTLIVRDQSGCEQHFDYTILNKRDCDYRITFSEGPTDCEIYVTVAPLDADPEWYSLGGSVSAQISWSDGGPEVFTRLLDKEVVESGTLSFVYAQLLNGEICCQKPGVIVPGEDWEEAPEEGCVPLCDYEVTVENTLRICEKLVTIIPDPAVLAGMDEPTFVVRWSDGVVTSGLTRLVNQYTAYGDPITLHAEVSVFELATCSEVCRFTFTIGIPANPVCKPANPDDEDKRLIINEFGTISGSPAAQYIELLVNGSGACGGVSDLRGIILDDNNGEIIPAGEFIHTYNRQLIGINEGFIYFAYDEAWAEVPNGSLIVLYNERDGEGILPADDPLDANEDHVYVLSLTEPSLFRGKTSWWNEDEKREAYEGVLDVVNWDKILIGGSADGIQVRFPSGEYMHGLSTGITPYAVEENPFTLWLGEMSAGNAVCWLEGASPYDWGEFQCTSYSATAVSPGLPNSEKNASLLAKLLSCDPEEEELPTGEEEERPAVIKAVQATIDADVSSYSSPGQVITYTITVTNTGNTALINLGVYLSTGVGFRIPVLLPCETKVFTITHEVDCEDLANEDGITGTVTVFGQATATDEVHISNESINLTLTKTATSSFIEGVLTVRFFLKLNNLSPNEATGVSIEDYLPNDGYSGVSNISNGGAVLSSGGSTSIIGWEDLVVPADDDLTLFFDVVVESEGSNFENCAEIIASDQYNLQTLPCDETPTAISSCVEPEICQLSVSIVEVDYDDNGTPLNPSDDEIYFEILVTAPVGVTGEWDIFGSSAGNFSGDFGVSEVIGPFPVGFEPEWLNIETKGNTDCEGTILISSPAVLGDFVWEDADLDGLQDSGEPGIPDMEVVLKQDASTIATTATSSTGHYLFTNLDPGSYSISINPATADWETVKSIDFQVALLIGIPEISGNAGFILSGYGATGGPTDKCVRSAFAAFNNYLSIQQTLSSDYEYRIRWNVKNSSTNPAQQKIMQLRYNTTATYSGTDIGAPYTIPQIAVTSPGAEYTSAVFSGLSGTYHLILATASGNSSANVNCYFDNFRLERRPLPLIPTTQNVGSDESIDSDINTLGVSGAVTLEAGDIYLDLDAGFAHGIELLGGNFPEESQAIAAETPGQDALLVYPNPFTETCRLQLGSIVAGDGIVTLYSALSQRILDVNTNLVFGSNDMKLELPESLPAGVYTVEVQFPSGKILTQKITKIRL